MFLLEVAYLPGESIVTLTRATGFLLLRFALVAVFVVHAAIRAIKRFHLLLVATLIEQAASFLA